MTTHRTPTEERKSVVVAALLMIGISLVLFMVPLINGFVGGAVGGYRAGSVGRALLAAIFPAVVVALGLWILFAVAQAPVLGLFAGLAVGVWIALADVGLFLGAALGGAAASARLGPQTA